MPGIHCGPWGYASTCQRTVPSSVLPQGLVECRLHSWGGVAACFPEKPAKLVAVLGSRNSYSSSTSTSSRDFDWEVLRGLHHGWTSREACLPLLALCAVSQPHVGWAWVSGGGCPDSVVPALDSQCSIGAWQISDRKADGAGGPGSVWAPPWLPKGRALKQRGFKSDSKTNSPALAR